MYSADQLRELIRLAHALGYDDDVERYKRELSSLESAKQ